MLCSNLSIVLRQAETAIRTLILALGFIVAALPARAQTTAPAEVKAHVGQTVTVQAAVSDVHTGRAGVTFIGIGGAYPDNDFAAVIFASDRAKFPHANDPWRSAARWCSIRTGPRSS
jgi:hypothetical protein